MSHLAELWRQPWAADAITCGDVAEAYRLLQRIGVSQRRIAALTGQQQSEVCEILTGRQVRDIRVVARIVDALELPREVFGLAPIPPDWTSRNQDHPAEDVTAALLPRCVCGGPATQPTPSRPEPSLDDIPESVPQADVAHEPPSPLIEVVAVDGARGLTVALWTGVEVRMLRQARRMSIREFADHLGVSDRMVSKWEARSARKTTPNPVNQATLDTSLSRATLAERARFTVLWRQAWPTRVP